jgi:hypothetical protein
VFVCVSVSLGGWVLGVLVAVCGNVEGGGGRREAGNMTSGGCVCVCVCRGRLLL